MISVLAHELVHIGDGDGDALRPLFRAVGARASQLTAMRVRDQRAEELTCDLVGTLAVQTFITKTPNYDPLPRRLARSIEHNCVEEDDSRDIVRSGTKHARCFVIFLGFQRTFGEVARLMAQINSTVRVACFREERAGFDQALRQFAQGR